MGDRIEPTFSRQVEPASELAADKPLSTLTNVVVPAISESLSEVTVSKWHKSVGALITVDDPLVEIEFPLSKLSEGFAEVEGIGGYRVLAPLSGTLDEIVATVGATVPVGGTLGFVKPGPPPSNIPIPGVSVSDIARSSKVAYRIGKDQDGADGYDLMVIENGTITKRVRRDMPLDEIKILASMTTRQINKQAKKEGVDIDIDLVRKMATMTMEEIAQADAREIAQQHGVAPENIVEVLSSDEIVPASSAGANSTALPINKPAMGDNRPYIRRDFRADRRFDTMLKAALIPLPRSFLGNPRNKIQGQTYALIVNLNRMALELRRAREEAYQYEGWLISACNYYINWVRKDLNTRVIDQRYLGYINDLLELLQDIVMDYRARYPNAEFSYFLYDYIGSNPNRVDILYADNIQMAMASLWATKISNGSKKDKQYYSLLERFFWND